MDKLDEMLVDLDKIVGSDSFKEYGFAIGGKWHYFIKELNDLDGERARLLQMMAYRYVINNGNLYDPEISELKRLFLLAPK